MMPRIRKLLEEIRELECARTDPDVLGYWQSIQYDLDVSWLKLEIYYTCLQYSEGIEFSPYV